MNISTNGRLPQDISVEFNHRSDTYSDLLGYIKPDGKGTKSSWGDSSIVTKTYKNEPTSGFVLNNATNAGYSRNKRDIKVRVHDPRGFEFEISVKNLLFILEYNGCGKGKSLNGEYVYYWEVGSGSVILLPTITSTYKELSVTQETSTNLKVITSKELKIGNKYRNDRGVEMVYCGDIYIKGKKSLFTETDAAYNDIYYSGRLWVGDKSILKTFKPIIDLGVDSEDTIGKMLRKEHVKCYEILDEALTLKITDESVSLNEPQQQIFNELYMGEGPYFVFGWCGSVYSLYQGTFDTIYKIILDKKHRLISYEYMGSCLSRMIFKNKDFYKVELKKIKNG